jgi:hypothetical protein
VRAIGMLSFSSWVSRHPQRILRTLRALVTDAARSSSSVWST